MSDTTSTCKLCGKEFFNNYKDRKFCSVTCRVENNRKGLVYTEFCRYCGQPLGKKGWRNKFCNRNCSSIFNNKLKSKRQIKPRICSKCGMEFTFSEKTSRILCETCKIIEREKTNVIKAMTIREYIQKYSYKGANRYSTIRDFARRWNKHLKKKPCQNCGYSKHTEFCHIKEINKNLDMTIGEINDENNILILCKNCHWEFDHGYLTLDILQKSC